MILFLPFALYGPPLAPVIIMSVTSIIIFFTNFTSNPIAIMILESSLVIAGYLILYIRCVASNLDDHIATYWSEVKQRFTSDTTESIYDNPPTTHDD
jgi:hypothetical protein